MDSGEKEENFILNLKLIIIVRLILRLTFRLMENTSNEELFVENSFTGQYFIGVG